MIIIHIGRALVCVYIFLNLIIKLYTYLREFKFTLERFFITLMLLGNFANRKRREKPKNRILKTLQMVTHLRVHRKTCQMNTNMTGSDLLKIASLYFERK